MTATETLGLATFNALPVAEAERILLHCCASSRWAREVASGRPYPSVDDLCAASDSALDALTESDVDEAMAGHPRIGDRATDEHSTASRREQAGMVDASAETVTALSEGNAEYEARFGHVYLVSADGRTGEELLALLRQRLRNDPATERAQARAELGKINRIRLRRLLAAESGAGAETGAPR